MIARELSSPYVISIADARERQHHAKRTCAHDGCGTILSQYNDSTYCAAHEPEPELLHYEGYTFRLCRCGEVFRVYKDGGSRLCPACKRAELADERKRRAFRERTKPLRKDGRRDALQRAQRKIAARPPAARPTVTVQTSRGTQRHEVSQ